MSGHCDDKILVASRFAYLQKPFTPETLTRKVREVLDARGE
jgi:DNA-binding response OmpR family regulator